jgi:hypothetical protein
MVLPRFALHMSPPPGPAGGRPEACSACSLAGTSPVTAPPVAAMRPALRRSPSTRALSPGAERALAASRAAAGQLSGDAAETQRPD